MAIDKIKKEFIDTQVATFRRNDKSEGGLINKHKIVLSMILDHSSPSDRVLDIGCSEGKILKELQTMGYKKLYGVDIQDWAETSLAGTDITYRVCDIEHEPLPFRGQFELIIISDVLEHLFSPQTVLYDLKKYLSPGGKIVFSVPNAGWWMNGILLTFFPSKLFVSTAFGPWGHTHQFTFYEVRRMAAKLKYKQRVLKGGRLDNYAFKAGVKKIIFDIFALLSLPLLSRSPAIFSAHIFGVLQNSPKIPPLSAKYDIGL